MGIFEQPERNDLFVRPLKNTPAYRKQGRQA
jgi:hypothetical protein